MTESLRRVAVLAVVLAVAACARPGPEAGGLADRGIGGTGAPAREADRGIGGTGIDTAIIGMITGFGSVRVDGLEVADETIREVSVDGRTRPVASLQVGQIARIVASSGDGALRARSVATDHEVVGPVQRMLGPDFVLVAGQAVRVSAETIGAVPTVGRWIAVSGLRDADGVVRATRLDALAPGEAIVVGRLSRESGAWRIGGLRIAVANAEPLGGQRVRVFGRLSGGMLVPRRLEPALLVPGPAAPERLIVQAFARGTGDIVRLGDGDDVARGPDLGALPPDGPVVVSITRAPDGRLTATGILGSGDSGGRGGAASGATDAGRGAATGGDAGAGGHAGATNSGGSNGGASNGGAAGAGSPRGEVATVGAPTAGAADGHGGGGAGHGGGPGAGPGAGPGGLNGGAGGGGNGGRK